MFSRDLTVLWPVESLIVSERLTYTMDYIYKLHKSKEFFLPRDAMRKLGLCRRPVSVCHVRVLYPDG